LSPESDEIKNLKAIYRRVGLQTHHTFSSTAGARRVIPPYHTWHGDRVGQSHFSTLTFSDPIISFAARGY